MRPILFSNRRSLSSLLASLLAAGWIAIGAATASAQAAEPATAPADTAALDPEALVAEALAGAPSLAALRARVAAAEASVSSASALPDPMIEGMLQNVGVNGLTIGDQEMSMAQVEVRQPLPWFGKRTAKRAAAEAEKDVAGADLASTRREVAARVRSIAADLYALGQEERSLAAGGELLRMLLATITARYGAGQADQEAVLKQQVAVARLEERRDDLAVERSAKLAELAALLGRAPESLQGQVRILPSVAAPQRPWEDLAASASPDVARKRAAVASAERQLRVAQVEGRPNAFVGGGYGYRGGFDPVVTLRMGFELPLWNRGRLAPLRRAAEFQVESARQEQKAAEAAARGEAARLQARWDASERQITRYREAILPQTAAALDAARSGYLAGRGDFATVVEDFNAWLDARAQLARREADRYDTWAALQSLVSPSAGLGQGGGS